MLEHTPLFVMTFEGMVESSLVPGTGSGGFGTPGRFLASDKELSLHWGAISIKINNGVLDFERDWDGRENMVGGTINAMQQFIGRVVSRGDILSVESSGPLFLEFEDAVKHAVGGVTLAAPLPPPFNDALVVSKDLEVAALWVKLGQ